MEELGVVLNSWPTTLNEERANLVLFPGFLQGLELRRVITKDLVISDDNYAAVVLLEEVEVIRDVVVKFILQRYCH